MALVRFTRRQPRLAFPGFFPSTAFPTFDDVENRMSRFIERALNEPFAAGVSVPWLGPTASRAVRGSASASLSFASTPGAAGASVASSSTR